MEKEEFDYFDVWEEVEEKESKNKINEFSKGFPRTGLKGKYLKANTGNVSKKRIKNSYGRYFKGLKE